MGNEAASIAAVDKPATVASLTNDLAILGINSGDVVMVHASMSALGYVAGGAQAVVEALLGAVGTDGTIVMPAQSGHLSDPAGWQAPPVPPEWVQVIRDETPAYDPYLTQTRLMGQVVECFRQLRETERSPHPLYSFVAHGPKADAIVGTHPLDAGFGEGSPLGRLYELDARVLLLGTTHANNTSMHLAEYRANWAVKASTQQSAPVMIDGIREWTTWTESATSADDFAQAGEAFAETDHQVTGTVGAGIATLMSQRAVVDFAVTWMEANRPDSLAE